MAKPNRYASKIQKQSVVNGQVIRGLSQEAADRIAIKCEKHLIEGGKLSDPGGKVGAVLKAKGLI